jgi:hypothetical protein
MNWTLDVFELHQYLISLLRKMQNTFSERQWKSQFLADGNFFPERKFATKPYITSTGP